MTRNLSFILLLLLVSIYPLQATANDDETDVRDLPRKERFFIGGYLGLQIGTITSVNISPTIAYRFTNRFTGGLGATYQYYRDRAWGTSEDFSTTTHIYGGSAFARYNITPQFFLQTEYEALNLDSQMGFSLSSKPSERFWEHNYFAGAGYRARLGPKTYLNLMLMYNFNNESVVYYQNPMFRFGIDVRL